MITVVVAEHEQTAAVPLPATGSLTERQLLGIDCAKCGAYLGVDTQRLGEIQDHGYLLHLYSCDPHCAPPTNPPPPWHGTLLARLPRWNTATSTPDLLPDSYDNSTATMRRVAARLRTLNDTHPPERRD